MLSFKSFLLEKWKPQEGESELVYHSSSNNFDKFRPLSHFGSKNAARTIASYKSTQGFTQTRGKNNRLIYTQTPSNYYTARIRLGKVVDIEDDGNDHTAIDILNAAHHHGHVSRETYDTARSEIRRATVLANKSEKYKVDYSDYSNLKQNGARRRKMELLHKSIVAKHLRKSGVDTIRYRNEVEDAGNHSYIITHPSQVRMLKKGKSILRHEIGLEKK